MWENQNKTLVYAHQAGKIENKAPNGRGQIKKNGSHKGVTYNNY